MPFTQPWFEVDFGSNYAGIGTTGYRLYQNDGTDSVARTTSGVVDLGNGAYGVPSVSVPDNAAGIEWDTGGGSPVYAREDIEPYRDRAIVEGKLPTNYLMGSSVQTDKDDEIDAIKAVTDLLPDAGALTTIDSVVDAIKAVTDLLPNAGALTDIDTGINNIEAKLPTNYIMGSSDQTDKDGDIDAILVDTDALDQRLTDIRAGALDALTHSGLLTPAGVFLSPTANTDYLAFYSIQTPARVYKLRGIQLVLLESVDVPVTIGDQQLQGNPFFDGTYVYQCVQGYPSGASKVVKIRASDMTIMAEEFNVPEPVQLTVVIGGSAGEIIASGSTITGSQQRIYKITTSTMVQSGSTWQTGVTNEGAPNLAFDGTYIYATPFFLSPSKVYKITYATMATSLTWTGAAGENAGRCLTYLGGYVYIGLGISPGKIVEIDVSTMVTNNSWTGAAGENNIFDIDNDGTNIHAVIGVIPGVVKKFNSSLVEQDQWVGEPGDGYISRISIGNNNWYLLGYMYGGAASPNVKLLLLSTFSFSYTYAKTGGVFGVARPDDIAYVDVDVESMQSDITDILADTDELQTDWADGGRLDTILDGIVTTLSTMVADVWSYATRTLTSFGTLIADIWSYATRTLTAGTKDAEIDLILSDTDELQGDWEDGGRLDNILDSLVTGQGSVGDDIDLLIAFIRNKKYIAKDGTTWYLHIRNATDDDDILKKELKDKDGNDISDPAAGVLAQELEDIA